MRSLTQIDLDWIHPLVLYDIVLSRQGIITCIHSYLHDTVFPNDLSS